MKTVRLLVVDDEPGIRAGVSRALRNFSVQVPDFEDVVNFEVIQAETGEEGLACIQADPPGILLLDNKLPGISGMEVLEQIGPMGLEMHTVIITAYASIETAVRATKQGAFDFLPKPFTPLDLKNTIQKVTRHLILSQKARALDAEKRKVRFQFISVLAHELKAPINAVEGYLRILEDPKAITDEKKYTEFVQRCLVRTEYMRKMIADLLDLTRIESGERKREIRSLNLVEIARTAIDTFLPEAEQREICIDLEAPESVSLCADSSEMEVILNNLVSNAVKYNRDAGEVNVKMMREGDQVSIVVRDTGIGMSEEERGKIFKDFVRIKNEKTSAILGSGLGLSTVKKLAMMYQGDATVESTPDVGSTFSVCLFDLDQEEGTT